MVGEEILNLILVFFGQNAASGIHQIAATFNQMGSLIQNARLQSHQFVYAGIALAVFQIWVAAQSAQA